MFLDTAALVALIDKTDALHARAVQVEAELGVERAHLVTSEWVLSELLAYAAAPPLRSAALRALDTLAGEAEVISADHGSFKVGLNLYRSRLDKSWSLVDCISIVVCRAKKIERVFTHDRHFAQAGLRVLL